MFFSLYILLLSSAVLGTIAASSKKPTIANIVLATLISHGYLTTYATMKEVSGYSTNDDLPNEFEVVWARVVEDQGEKYIEMWALYDTQFHDRFYSKFSLASVPGTISRVHILPYSSDSHEFVLEAQEKITSGQKIGMVLEVDEELGEIDLRKSESEFQIRYENSKIVK